MARQKKRDVLDYFQFDANAWLTSAAVIAMTPAQEGAYIHLLAIQAKAKDCTLPNDDTLLAALSRLGEEWGTTGRFVREQFEVSDEDSSKIFNRILHDKWSHAWGSYKARCKRNKLNRVTGTTTRQRVVNDSSTSGKPLEPRKKRGIRVKNNTDAASAAEVFAYWQSVFSRPGTEFTKDRQRRVYARLKEGATVEEIKQGIDGCRASTWHMAEGQTDLELICRSASKLDTFRAKAPKPVHALPVEAPPTPDEWEAARRRREEVR